MQVTAPTYDQFINGIVDQVNIEQVVNFQEAEIIQFNPGFNHITRALKTFPFMLSLAGDTGNDQYYI
jgi:hypothetical protein